MRTFHNRLEKFVENHPMAYYYGKRLFHFFPFLLPHDKEMLGIRHLVQRFPTGLVLDVGANDGVSALYFLRLCNEWQVFSIEPNKLHHSTLERIKVKKPKFDYMICAAGEHLTKLQLATPVHGKYPIHSAASLKSESEHRAYLFSVYPQRFVERCHLEKQEVEVKPIDDLNLNPKIVKIDTEGFDHLVVRGMKRTIESNRPAVIIEHNLSNIEEIRSYFESLGYVTLQYRFQEDKFFYYSSGARYRNVYCIPKDMQWCCPMGLAS